MNETPPLAPEIQYQQPQTSTLAICALVFGILAIVLLIVCVGPLFAIPAIICGHLGCSRIKKSGGLLTGRGMAIAGFITGYASFGLAALLAIIAIPNFVKAREAAMRNACRNNLRQIANAKQQWASDNKKENGISLTLGAAELDKYLSLRLAEMKCLKGGIYTINPLGKAPTCSIPEHDLQPADLSQP